LYLNRIIGGEHNIKQLLFSLAASYNRIRCYRYLMRQAASVVRLKAAKQ